MPRVQAEFDDYDHGWQRVHDTIKSIGVKITVGIHSEDNVPYARGQDDAPTLAQIATFHEFGAPKIGLPERSFMRWTMDENEAAYFGMAEDLLGLVIDGKISKYKAGAWLGERMKADIRQRIVDVERPPLTPSTIRAKKKGYGREQDADVDMDEPIQAPSSGPRAPDVADTGNPLLDTGQMKNAVDYQVHGQDRAVA